MVYIRITKFTGRLRAHLRRWNAAPLRDHAGEKRRTLQSFGTARASVAQHEHEEDHQGHGEPAGDRDFGGEIHRLDLAGNSVNTPLTCALV